MLLFITLLACVGFLESEQDMTGQLQAVGDSFLDWNVDSANSIPEQVGEILGLEVQNNAIGGALFSAEDDEDIRQQYESNGSAWVLMTGGGNDLNEECGCGDCEANVNGMIGADGMQGDIPTFVNSILDDGPNVVILGYYSIPEEAGDFIGCNDELESLANRYEQFSMQTDGVLFVDARSFITPQENIDAYDSDLVHPSVEGGRILAEALSTVISNF